MIKSKPMLPFNQILFGDCVQLLPTIPDNSIDLIIADPPYNLGKDYGNNQDNQDWQAYATFTQRWLNEAHRILKPNGSIYVFMGVRFIAQLFGLLEQKFIFNSWITWHYTQGMGRKVGFSPRHEDILFFTKSSHYTFNLDAIRIPQKYFRKRNNMEGANPGDMWQFSHVHYSNPERQAHPTQKPEALLERIIRASSNEQDVILDPFVGSGTTCRVAQVLNRQRIGIDINPDYIAMTHHRLGLEFVGFDSQDPRADRTPKDLPTSADMQKTLL
jgi:site-specific DNA-methyltransferase (adenine-specific)